MAKKVDYKILKKFCGDELDLRPQLTEPHLVDDYWVATNAHIIAMCRTEICSKKIRPRNVEGRFPNVFAVFNPETDSNPTHIVTLQDLRSALDLCYKVDEVIEEPTDNILEKCPACYGDGEIEDSVHFRGKYYDYSCECPICHGFGKVPVSEDYDPDDDIDPQDFEATIEVKTGKKILDKYLSVVDINGCIFRAFYILLICEFMEHVGVDAAKIWKKKDMLVFEFPHAFMCLMRILENPNKDVDPSKVTTTQIYHGAI